MHNTLTAVSHSLDGIGWLLMFLGWLMYWLKEVDKARRSDPSSFWSIPLQKFLFENAMEIPISLLACVILATIAKDIPTELIDMRGKLAVLVVGYFSSSTLNGLLSMRKPVPPATTPNP